MFTEPNHGSTLTNASYTSGLRNSTIGHSIMNEKGEKVTLDKKASLFHFKKKNSPKMFTRTCL